MICVFEKFEIYKKTCFFFEYVSDRSLISHHEDQLDILGQRLYDLRTHNTPASPQASLSSRRRSKDDVALSSTGKANGRRHRSTKSLFHEEVKTRSHRHHKSESHELVFNKKIEKIFLFLFFSLF